MSRSHIWHGKHNVDFWKWKTKPIQPARWRPGKAGQSWKEGEGVVSFNARKRPTSCFQRNVFVAQIVRETRTHYFYELNYMAPWFIHSSHESKCLLIGSKNVVPRLGYAPFLLEQTPFVPPLPKILSAPLQCSPPQVGAWKNPAPAPLQK